MPRHPQPSGRRAVARLTAGLVALVATVALLPASDVAADPVSSVADARRELQALNTEVAVVVEDYATTQIALAAAQRRAAAAAAKVAREEARLSELRAGLADMVGAIYMSGGADQMMSLVTTASPSDFLDRAASLDAMARSRQAQVRAAAAVRLRLASEQARAAAAHRSAEQVARSAARTRSTIEAKVARQERLLDRLQSEQARRERIQREARAAALARQAASRPRARATRERTAAPVYTGAAEGRAAIAVKAAYEQLGKPYKWGASGPDRFDCSGLTMFVWAKAGVSLPHSSRAQRNMGRSISRSELRPGDLIFRGSPTIHHVGIYVGDGRMIAAPQTGDVVKLQPAFAGEYAGAVRL